jgi:hypothetical protein
VQPSQGRLYHFGANSLHFQGNSNAALERAMGFEPTTFSLARRHSTAESRPQAADRVAHLLELARAMRQQADALEKLALEQWD